MKKKNEKEDEKKKENMGRKQIKGKKMGPYKHRTPEASSLPLKYLWSVTHFVTV